MIPAHVEVVTELHDIAAQLDSIAARLREMDADLAHALDGDEVWLARAIQGEGAALFGPHRDEVGRYIAWTVYSRMGKPWWPHTVRETVETAFHGTTLVDTPEPWALELARACVLRYRRGQLKADGPLFMLSGADLDAQGIEREGLEVRQVFEHQGHQMWFLDGNPWGK